MVTRARKKLRQNHGSDRSGRRVNFLSVRFPITRTAKCAKSRGGRLCDAGLDAQIERKLRQNGLARRLSQFSLNGAWEVFVTGCLNFFGQPSRLIFGVAGRRCSPGPPWATSEGGVSAVVSSSCASGQTGRYCQTRAKLTVSSRSNASPPRSRRDRRGDGRRARLGGFRPAARHPTPCVCHLRRKGADSGHNDLRRSREKLDRNRKLSFLAL